MTPVADSGPPAMAPNPRRQIQHPQPGCGHRPVRQILHLGVVLALKQRQPAVQVVSQHADLKVVGVRRPDPRWMCRQARVVVGFFDQILLAAGLTSSAEISTASPTPPVLPAFTIWVAPDPHCRKRDRYALSCFNPNRPAPFALALDLNRYAAQVPVHNFLCA